MKRSDYVFEADPKKSTKSSHPDWPKQPEPYLCSEQLVQAVNLAIYLGRPLLLEGEPGCGKTRLARAVAHQLGLPFYPWYVRSTSKVQEGLYHYDALLRLHDAQIGKSLAEQPTPSSQNPAPKQRDPANPHDYITYGALGKAFRMEHCPAVVLIDEIDKADIDFPNDLLNVLDDWEFHIYETNDEPIRVAEAYRPIVIITSNKEKGNLPTPFLRRCVYHYVEFPNDAKQLKEIVQVHYAQDAQRTMPDGQTTDMAIQRFLDVRKGERLHKKPGTSEFLDWIEALANFPTPHRPQLTAQGTLPYPGLLFKLHADWKKFAEKSRDHQGAVRENA